MERLFSEWPFSFRDRHALLVRWAMRRGATLDAVFNVMRIGLLVFAIASMAALYLRISPDLYTVRTPE